MKVILSPFPQYSEQAEVQVEKVAPRQANFSVHLSPGLLGLWVADPKIIVWLTNPVISKGKCSRGWGMYTLSPTSLYTNT